MYCNLQILCSEKGQGSDTHPVGRGRWGARKVSSNCIILAVKNGASTMETISKSDLCDE